MMMLMIMSKNQKSKKDNVFLTISLAKKAITVINCEEET